MMASTAPSPSRTSTMLERTSSLASIAPAADHKGNVAAGAIKTPLVSVTGVDDGKVSNLQPAVGGSDEQSIEDAKQRAASVLRSNGRAVTVSDFEELAQQAGNVRRAKALPLYHPRFPRHEDPRRRHRHRGSRQRSAESDSE